MKVKPAQKGDVLSIVAPLLEYPGADFFKSLDTICSSVSRKCPVALDALEKFKSEIDGYTVSELEELFTRTFDVAAICSPYISVHIYGDENFDRGNLMATLATKFEERGFDCGKELPDHLAVVLRFCEYLDEEELDELYEFCLTEPLENMSGALKGSKKTSPYYFVFVAVLEIFKTKKFL